MNSTAKRAKTAHLAQNKPKPPIRKASSERDIVSASLPPTRGLEHLHTTSSFNFRSLRVAVSWLAALFILCLTGAVFAQAPDPQQLFQEAAEAQQHGDAALAVRKYQELLRLHPEVLAAHANLGLVFDSLGRFDEAVAQFRAAVALAPGDRSLRTNLAMAYYQKGDLPNAIREFSSLLKDAPGDMQTATLLGNCYVRQGRPAQAVSLLTPLAASHPDDVSLQLTFGWALVRAGRTKEGLERIDKLAQQTNSAEAYMGAATAQLRLEALDQARRNVDAALRLNPHLPGLHTLSGMIAADFGDYEGAEAAFEKELESNPSDFSAQLNLGSVLYSQRKLDTAREHLERALALAPASSQALYDLALVERAQGHMEAAVKDLEKVVGKDPQWLEPHVELAALYYRLNRPQDGAHEKQVVDRLANEQRTSSKGRDVNPQTP
jgi:tetratricopeptide (TPR) repeat protein